MDTAEEWRTRLAADLAAGRRKLEQSSLNDPAVRRAGGVYYTPKYIVDYIVRQTVGKLLETAKTPGDAASLAIVDPACGDGAFLLGAYDYLLDWHRLWYIANEPQDWGNGQAGVLCQDRDGQWQLTIRQRQRILFNNIHGVDLDPYAIDVARLSLSLKALQGSTDASLDGLSPEQGLAELAKNVKCGNSLIGPDLATPELVPAYSSSPPSTEQTGPESAACDCATDLRPFDWSREFPEIFSRGGFDAVIGNPPYLNGVEGRTRFGEIVNAYLRSRFASARGAIDASILFQELGLRLLRTNGRTAMIVPNKFLSAPFGAAFRSFAAAQAEIRLLADFSAANVFAGVATYPVVYVLEKMACATRELPAPLSRYSGRGLG